VLVDRARSDGRESTSVLPRAAEALTQLADLHARGVLTDDELAAQKAKLLA